MTDAPAAGIPQNPYGTLVYPVYPAPPQRSRSIPARALTMFWAQHRSPLQPRAFVALAAVGVLSAVFVVGHEVGLGLALAGLVMLAPAVVAMVRRRAWSPAITATIAIALAATAAFRDAEWVVILCLLGAFGLSAVAVSAARGPVGIALAIPALPFAAARGVAWARKGAVEGVRGRSGQAWRGVRTVLITTLILVVFTALLASADAVFATLLPSWNLELLPAQIVIGAMAATLALAGLSLAVARPVWSRVRLRRAPAARRLEWFMPVLALDAVMVAFLVTQLVAAIGGDDYVQQTAGLTYASYARQGFGQLVAVTALTLIFVTWAARRAPREHRRDAWTTRAALGLLCLAALGIVATALGRMALYVQAYGLTELRILATTGEIVMGVIVLLVLVAGVKWHGAWLPIAVLRVAGVALLGLALANPEGLIVTYNTQAQNAPVDVYHLTALSDDAVPAIDQLPEPLRSCVLARYDSGVDPSVWGWNLARQQALALDDVAEQPDCASVYSVSGY